MSPVVPMPAFASNDPKTLGGSINFGHPKYPGLEDHPVEHSADYGGGVADTDRDSWSRNKWADLAKHYGVAVGGTKQELINRVESHEASLAEEGGQ